MFQLEDLDPEELKVEANMKWANGEAEDANTLWRMALKECIKYSMRGFPTKKNRDMQLSLRLNLSLYHFKKREYHECINQCDIILEGIEGLEALLTRYEEEQIDLQGEGKESSLPEHVQAEKELNEVKAENYSHDNTDTAATAAATAAAATATAATAATTTTTEEEEEEGVMNMIKRETLMKIFLRKANSFLHLQEFEKCKENIKLVRRIDKWNVEAMNLEKKQQIEQIQYEQMQKQLYRRMCNVNASSDSKGMK
ncbi:hypothetical protein PGO_031520 [Plasmodium gonderi]|uniref:Uncharacterized protein n=1 Tax=Plasmodium gonderi TaxID=77519 RepID=A0A1Y1JCE6_PLAGO|nr:hypothetical protein PGO_031520 [Plasmodium gonderi]GAW79348.1 hypothetical protein PGO_031520 [Plasmodium gonderi]